MTFSPTLKKGSVELLVLSLLAEKQLHGYEIGKQIENLSGGHLQYRISSLYPVLVRLEKRGWISGRWVEKAGQRRRRYYRLTDRGTRALEDQRSTWEAFTAAVDLVVSGGNA